MGNQKSKVVGPAEEDPEVARVFNALSAFHINPALLEMAESVEQAEGGYGFVRRAKLWQINEDLKDEFHYRRIVRDDKTFLLQEEPNRSSISKLVFKEKVIPCTQHEVVAVKGLRFLSDVTYFRMRRRYAREILVWARLQHPNVIHFVGWHVDFEQKIAWFVCPWEKNGNAREYVAKKKPVVKERLRFLEDTADGLAYLHSVQVSHGDMKAANVLISDERKALICDFGLAAAVDGTDNLNTSTGFKGSIRWCSPELFANGKRTPQSDVWAWGFTAYEIMTGKLPHWDSNVQTVIMRCILEGRVPTAKSTELKDVPKVLVELFQATWAKEPKNRPTMAQCLSIVRQLVKIANEKPEQLKSAKTIAPLAEMLMLPPGPQVPRTPQVGEVAELEKDETVTTTDGDDFTIISLKIDDEDEDEKAHETADTSLPSSSLSPKPAPPVVADRITKPSGIVGGNGGWPFSDVDFVNDERQNYVRGIQVHSHLGVHEIRVLYHGKGGKVWANSHGSSAGPWEMNKYMFTLKPGEVINKIEGRAGDKIDSIQFFTNLGQASEKCGGPGGVPFTWTGDELMYFSGRAGDQLDGLQAHWAGYPNPNVTLTSTLEARKYDSFNGDHF